MVRLSGDTAAKQTLRRGGKFTSQDYALVQRALDEGEWFEERARHVVGYVGVDAMWKIVLKRTHDATRVYLQSLHRSYRTQRDVSRDRLIRLED